MCGFNNVRLFAFAVAPTVSVPHQLVGAPLGSSVTLDCHLESSPSALHFWSREGGTVLHNATKYRMLTVPAGSASAYRTHLKLTIVSVTDADYGPYRCVAKNPFGEADGVIKLYRKSSIHSLNLHINSLGPSSARPFRPMTGRCTSVIDRLHQIRRLPDYN